MTAGWFLLTLIIAGTTILFATRTSKRGSPRGLDRAFDRAKSVRLNGGMKRDRLY